jgi:hypothetical protein
MPRGQVDVGAFVGHLFLHTHLALVSEDGGVRTCKLIVLHAASTKRAHLVDVVFLGVLVTLVAASRKHVGRMYSWCLQWVRGR